MFLNHNSTPWPLKELRRTYAPRWTQNQLAKMTPPQRKAAVQEMAGWPNSNKKKRTKKKRQEK